MKEFLYVFGIILGMVLMVIVLTSVEIYHDGLILEQKVKQIQICKVVDITLDACAHTFHWY